MFFAYVRVRLWREHSSEILPRVKISKIHQDFAVRKMFDPKHFPDDETFLSDMFLGINV